jgi:hypothetical protein
MNRIILSVLFTIACGSGSEGEFASSPGSTSAESGGQLEAGATNPSSMAGTDTNIGGTSHAPETGGASAITDDGGRSNGGGTKGAGMAGAIGVAGSGGRVATFGSGGQGAAGKRPGSGGSGANGGAPTGAAGVGGVSGGLGGVTTAGTVSVGGEAGTHAAVGGAPNGGMSGTNTAGSGGAAITCDTNYVPVQDINNNWGCFCTIPAQYRANAIGDGCNSCVYIIPGSPSFCSVGVPVSCNAYGDDNYPEGRWVDDHCTSAGKTSTATRWCCTP